MNATIIAKSKTLALADAILLYRDGTSAYAVVHDVVAGPAGPVLAAGRRMTLRGLRAMASALLKTNWSSGVLPAAVLSVGINHVVWYCPPGRHLVHWSSRDSQIGRRSGVAAHPGLVFALVGAAWYVWATTEPGRPAAATELFNAPFMNVFASGEICRGSTEVPATHGPDVVDAWTAAWWASAFTGQNHRNACRYAGGLNQLWLDLLAGAEFPNGCLVPHETTLGALIQNLDHGVKP